MSPTQPSIPPIPTTVHSQTSTSIPSSKWHTLAAIFLTLFLTLLLASTTALCHLHRRHTRLQAAVNGHARTHTTQDTTPGPSAAPGRDPGPGPNPHPFGSAPWRDHELARVPPASRDALRAADLEAQNDLLEQRAEVLEGLAEMLDRQNRRLGRENAGLRLDPYCGAAAAGAVPDPEPEVLRRVYEEVHRPVERRAVVKKEATVGDQGGFELQEIRAGGFPLEVSGLVSSLVVGGPANDETGRFSGEFDHDPGMDPAGRGTPVDVDHRRDTSCSAGTSDAVISDRPRSLAFHLEVESGRSRSSSGFSDISEDFFGKHVTDTFI